MHVTELLHKLIGKSCQTIDKRITRTLFEAVETLIHCKQLSIAALGRSLDRVTYVKHTIKCMDRLFGNPSLQAKRCMFYQAMTQRVVSQYARPVILVDWSGLTRCGQYHFLRASIAVRGRVLTLYEQAFSISQYGQYQTHRQFLLTLKLLLPADCRPVIVTDAGFRNHWFKLVISLGWDFLGRVRHNTYYQDLGSDQWRPIKELYASANYQARRIGTIWLAKSNPHPCDIYLMKQRKKSRINRNLIGKKARCSMSLKHAKRGNEPWLIVTSVDHQSMTAKSVMGIYRKRMQIEEAFRDLKNTRNGFGLRHCRSTGKERLNIALLIAALAMFICWMLGMVAKQKQLHYRFQSNTERNNPVLSCFTIGWQVLERRMYFPLESILHALQEIPLYANY